MSVSGAHPHGRLPGAHGRLPALGVVAAVAAIAAAAIALFAGSSGHRAEAGAPHVRPATAAAHTPGAEHPGVVIGGRPGGQPPNIVFVLTDDLSMNLLRFMPAVQALERRGMTFGNYFVSDSLCCPSRASIFTGDYPHDTGVFTNVGHDGGMTAFWSHHDQNRTFNIALQRAGYRTAMMGKYLNGYLEPHGRDPIPHSRIPPGWNEWDVAGWGYPEYDYRMNIDGSVYHFGHAPRDYLTYVLARRGVRFIDRATASNTPFFLELATFSPHFPYTPAHRDRRLFRGLTAPHPPSFDVLPTDPPAWLAGRHPFTDRQRHQIDRVFRLRAQDVQSIDRMIRQVIGALARNHVLHNTYIVFSSDNGLHTGEHRLMPGKLTAFDTDIHVPLVVAGPGVPPGSVSSAVAENVDLAETFAGMGGTTLAGDGHSLMSLLSGAPAIGWRNAALIEHHGPATSIFDPDRQSDESGNPTTYEAMRTPDLLYVEYTDGERELYDLRTDPFELHNIAPIVPAARLERLHAQLARLEICHGGAACWAAGHVAGPSGA
ncbi:MAG: sulfatase family protein [Solirubrobacteraceae bacterium]